MSNANSAVAVVLASIAVLAGCGGAPDDQPELVPVQGTVTLDGEPLADAQIVFQPETGRPSRGETNEQGHYELQYTPDTRGARVGTHTVRISTGRTVYDDDENPTEIPEKVPARYNENSELTKKVEPGTETIDFELSTGEGEEGS